MFIYHYREKLFSAIAYFLSNTYYCHTLKLFKLLNFLDFEHYRQTGRSVTGLDYYAYEMGPVPADLYKEIQQQDGEGAVPLEVRETTDDLSRDLIKREFKSSADFDEDYFTPREMEIMERLAFFFKETKSEIMSQYSHSPNLPWKKVYGKGEGRGKFIPYELALQSDAIVMDSSTIDEQERLILQEVFQGTGLR